MRYWIGFVLFLLALGTLRVVGCGGDARIPCDPDLLGGDCPEVQCNAAECLPDAKVCVYGAVDEGELCLSGSERGLCSDGGCVELRQVPCEGNLDCPRAPERFCGYTSCGEDKYCEYTPRDEERGCNASDGSVGMCRDGVCTPYSGEIGCGEAWYYSPCRTADGREGECWYGLCGGPEFCEGVVCDPAEDLCQRVGCNWAGECEYLPVRCYPPDSCQTAHCDPTTGECVNRPVPDGEVCDYWGTCSPGRCASGECVRTPEPDGQACNDFTPSSLPAVSACESGRCASGECVGTQVPNGQTCHVPAQCVEYGQCCWLWGTFCWTCCYSMSEAWSGVCEDGSCSRVD